MLNIKYIFVSNIHSYCKSIAFLLLNAILMLLLKNICVEMTADLDKFRYSFQLKYLFD